MRLENTPNFFFLYFSLAAVNVLKSHSGDGRNQIPLLFFYHLPLPCFISNLLHVPLNSEIASKVILSGIAKILAT